MAEIVTEVKGAKLLWPAIQEWWKHYEEGTLPPVPSYTRHPYFTKPQFGIFRIRR